jgi:hypothetical protein
MYNKWTARMTLDLPHGKWPYRDGRGGCQRFVCIFTISSRAAVTRNDIYKES